MIAGTSKLSPDQVRRSGAHPLKMNANITKPNLIGKYYFLITFCLDLI